MSLRAQLWFWAVALAVLIVGLWLFSEILLPFIAGLVLAYFLDPVADALERLGLPRLAATLVIVLASVVALAIASGPASADPGRSDRQARHEPAALHCGARHALQRAGARIGSRTC